MTPGRPEAQPAEHRAPDADAGDESTVGGYAAVHSRPPAFEAVDGFSYSVEMCGDETGEGGAAAWGGYFLFLRWRRLGAQGVEGHLESDFVTRAPTEVGALDALGRVPLRVAKATLDTLVRRQQRATGAAPTRRWWTVAAAEVGEDAAGDDAARAELSRGDQAVR